MDQKYLLFLLLFRDIGAENILAIFTCIAPSHLLIADPLLDALAERGHTLTVLSLFPRGGKHPNYKEIDLEHCLNVRSWPQPGLDFYSKQTIFDLLYFNQTYFDVIFNCEPFKELLRSNEKFDLLITELFISDVFLLFAEKFHVPVVAFMPSYFYSWLAGRHGVSTNPAYIPEILRDPGAPSNTFTWRLQNTVSVILGKIYFWKYSDSVMQEIADRRYPAGKKSLKEIARDIPLILTYSFQHLHPARPYPPGVIDISGINVKPSSPLPKDIEKFLNESEHGVVYFCMGSLLKGSSFPEEKRAAFLEAFDQIPQRVLWKWEGEELPGKTNKIMIRKWMPQRDILAHPNVRLFISHGGLLGTSEAVYEGVPILGIPIFGDQTTNIKAIEAAGAGEMLPYDKISKETVTEKVKRLLEDPKYRENAKQLSFRYKDRPMSPLDTAVYWTEYVIRHKGAPHLKSAAVDLTWYQYLLLDVIAFLLMVATVAIFSVYYTMKFVFNSIFGKKINKTKVKTN